MVDQYVLGVLSVRTQFTYLQRWGVAFSPCLPILSPPPISHLPKTNGLEALPGSSGTVLILYYYQQTFIEHSECEGALLGPGKDGRTTQLEKSRSAGKYCRATELVQVNTASD